MDTKTLNINTNNGSSKGKNVAATAAKAAASIGVGLGGAYAYTEMRDGSAEEETIIEEPVTEPTAEETQTPHPASGHQTTTSSQQTQTATTAPEPAETISEPEPITLEEPITEPEELLTEEEPVEIEEVVEPGEIAEAIIAEEQIDITDIDADDIVIFDEIKEEYNEFGEMTTNGIFHDENGQELVMVDVDNDGVFDYVTDTEDNMLGFIDGVTVDDAEVDLAEDNTYVAYTDDNYCDDMAFGDETLLDDMIS